MSEGNWKLDYWKEVLGVRSFLYPRYWNREKRNLSHSFEEFSRKNSFKKRTSFFDPLGFNFSKRGSLNGKWLFITEMGLKREDFEVLDRLTKALKAERNFLQILIDIKSLKSSHFDFLKFFLSFSNFRLGIFFGEGFLNFLRDSFLREEKIELHQSFLMFRFPLIVTYALHELRFRGNQEVDKDLVLRKKVIWDRVRNLVLDSNR